MSKLGTKAEIVIKRAAERDLTIATAESCTGGWVGKALTGVPGSSDAFLGGVISYDNSVKSGVLGVTQETLDTDGAVSEACAREMAEGAKKLLGADIAVSITGIAGPGGGNAEKPVGMVCFGLAKAGRAKTYTKQFDNLGRDKVRKKSVAFALDLLMSALN